MHFFIRRDPCRKWYARTPMTPPKFPPNAHPLNVFLQLVQCTNELSHDAHRCIQVWSRHFSYFYIYEVIWIAFLLYYLYYDILQHYQKECENPKKCFTFCQFSTLKKKEEKKKREYKEGAGCWRQTPRDKKTRRKFLFWKFWRLKQNKVNWTMFAQQWTSKNKYFFLQTFESIINCSCQLNYIAAKVLVAGLSDLTRQKIIYRLRAFVVLG